MAKTKIYEEELTPVKVLDVEEVKTFKVKVLIEKLEDNVELLVKTNPLPVTTESGETGCGTAYLEGNNLVADIIINYFSPERLLIETGEKLYAVAGMYTQMDPSREMPLYTIYEIRLSSVPAKHGVPIGSPIF